MQFPRIRKFVGNVGQSRVYEHDTRLGSGALISRLAFGVQGLDDFAFLSRLLIIKAHSERFVILPICFSSLNGSCANFS